MVTICYSSAEMKFYFLVFSDSSKEPTLDEESGTSAASDTNMEDCDTVSTLTVADLTNTSMKRSVQYPAQDHLQ